MFNLRNLKKVYKTGSVKTVALDDVSIDFPTKGLVVLLGKSGCGKSTLLNILGGLDKPTSGDVFVDGKNTKELKGSKSDAFRNSYIGYIFQEFNLIDELSVHDNIEMTLRIQDKNDKYMAVDDALEMVGLNNLGHRKPTELSGGQRQRVAIARALIKNSEILLADEPTGALDSNTAIEVFETLKKVAKQKLVIVVTHDAELAYDYATRVIEMNDGTIVKDVTRRSENEVFVRTLSNQVIEVTQGQPLSLDMINKNIDSSKVNYVGINYDLDRVTLAYPDIIDTLETKKQTIDYSDTKGEDILQKQPDFKLKKGKLSFKYAFGLAKKSIVTRKKKFNRLVVIASMGFVFTALSLIVSFFGQNNLLNRTVWTDEAIPLITVDNQRENQWDNHRPAMTQARKDTIANIAGINNVGMMHQDLNIMPILYNQVGSGANSFLFREFTTVIEGTTPQDLSLNVIHGSSNLSGKQVLISDFAAHGLIREGFLGTNPDGVLAMHNNLTNINQLVGFQIMVFNGYSDEIMIEVAGIFGTNFREFEWILSTSPMEIMIDPDLQASYDIFNNNNNMLYSALIVSDDFLEEVGSVRSYRFNPEEWGNHLRDFARECRCDPCLCDNWQPACNCYYAHVGDIQMNFNNDINIGRLEDIRFSTHVDRLRDEYDENYLIGQTNVFAPNFTLGSNQVILTRGMVESIWNLSGRNNEDINRIIELNLDYVDSWNPWNLVMNFAVCHDTGHRGSIHHRVVNVIDTDEVFFLVNDSTHNQIRGAFERVMSAPTVVIGRGTNRMAFNRMARELHNANFAFESSITIGLEDEWGWGFSIESSFRTLGQISLPFLITGLIFLGLSFLITLNYVAVTLRLRKKELLVYKVLGARNLDLSKIFLAEGIYIAIRITLLTSLGVFGLMAFINMVLMEPIPLLSFSLIYIPFIFVLVSIFLAISIFIPVRGIISKKPSEAMKLF